MQQQRMPFRTEKDFLGEKQIAAEVYYGIQTARALENFRITGLQVLSQPELIYAYAEIKKAAALANRDCGVLDERICELICRACDRIVTGEFNQQFATDLIQGGAGTSINMNMNEVIANIALESAGQAKGNYEFIHPNNHVNCSQSTNDTYPVAVSMALFKKSIHLKSSLQQLHQALLRKAHEFNGLLKMGRTQLQDAVPMYLGQEFNGFATSVGSCTARLERCIAQLTAINIGGTAIGTGVNAPPGYSQKAINYLSQISGLPLKPVGDFINASSDVSVYVDLSGVLKLIAVTVSKICNDLRLLASGPRCGIDEINLPRMQPGSSIMPGKINPVIPEVVNQVAFYVCGADVTITMAAEAGQLQLNVMEPVISFSLFTSLDYLKNSYDTLTRLCIDGITVNAERCRAYVMNSIGIVTLLNPVLGYESAALIAREASETGKSVHDIVVIERKLISREDWDRIFTVQNMVHERDPWIKPRR
jgi:aspartate ammonia-lyase